MSEALVVSGSAASSAVIKTQEMVTQISGVSNVNQSDTVFNPSILNTDLNPATFQIQYTFSPLTVTCVNMRDYPIQNTFTAWFDITVRDGTGYNYATLYQIATDVVTAPEYTVPAYGTYTFPFLGFTYTFRASTHIVLNLDFNGHSSEVRCTVPTWTLKRTAYYIE